LKVLISTIITIGANAVVMSDPFLTPPPFTTSIPIRTPDDGCIFPMSMVDHVDIHPARKGHKESKEFLEITTDTILTPDVRYLVIRSNFPLTVTLPEIRDSRPVAIDITTISDSSEPCNHTLLPNRSYETIQDQDIYSITGSMTIVSNKQNWYVF